MTGLIVAVDGGQSGIRVRTSSSPEVWETQGASRLEGDPLATIARLVVEVVQAHHIGDVATLSLGLSTVPGMDKVARDFAQSLGIQVHAKRVIVTDDALTHHAAQFQGAPGVALAIGTGTACTVVGSSGPLRSVSGYGFLLGDDGGAFWVGRQALRYVLDDRHSGKPDGSLSQAAATTFGPLEQLPALMHSRDRPVNDIAHFARDVFSALGEDPVALRVLQEACDALVGSSERALEVVKDDAGIDSIVWTSKLFTGYPQAQESLHLSLQARWPNSKVILGRGAPIDGALWLGHCDDFGPYGDRLIIENLEEWTHHVS
jgi:glucosamine kinase